jgi:hypothetical protein
MNGKASENGLTLKPPRRRTPKLAGGARLGQQRSTEARKQAAAILEVLAGARTPQQAASALAVSLPRYYQMEQRGLEGLLAACEPRPRGRVRSEAREVDELRRDNERLQRELVRQQTLVRLAQRSVGLSAPATPLKEAGKKRRRRPVARALAVARRLRQDDASAQTPATAMPQPAGG